LVISELMASNATVHRDRFREYPDWIEIHNTASESANLAGWYLTDDPENLTKWTFPDVTLDAKAYVVVFASGRNLPEANQMHTNFELDAQGDYLALVRPDGAVTHAYAPVYPAQFSDISYGLRYGADGPQQGQMTFFLVPTPGAANSGAEVSGQSTEVTASVERGYFSSPFTVTLSAADPQSVVRYTTDGTEPTFERGELYTGPIQVATTTTLRAVALNEGLLPGRVLTHSYIFLDDVLKQDGNGLPVEWGYFDDQGPRRPARARANYSVDPTVANDPRYRDTIRDDLRALPTVSIVMDPMDLWDFENGIYSNPERRGDAWERPISIEWMDVAGKTVFQTDAGLLHVHLKILVSSCFPRTVRSIAAGTAGVRSRGTAGL
jgi:hypothetical protein